MTGVVLALVLLRFIHLNQSLWLDEATTAMVALRYSIPQIVSVFSPTDFHPPFYYIFMHAWVGSVGSAEWMLRLPSVIFSLITAWTLYKIGLLLKKRELGMGAALLFLANPLAVYYAQEARMYMMATAFITLALYCYLKRSHVFFAIFSFLASVTFYGAYLFFASLIIYTAWRKKDLRRAIILATGPLVAFVLSAPLLFAQIEHASIRLEQVKNWSLVLGKNELKNLLLIPLKFSVGRVSIMPKVLYYLLGGVWTLYTVYLVIRGSAKRTDWAWFLVGPIVFGIVLSFIAPMMQYFRFLYVLPLFCLLMAAGISSQRQLYTVVTILAAFTLYMVLSPSQLREDWRGLAARVLHQPAVYMVYSASDPLAYYTPQVKVRDLLAIQTRPPRERQIIVIPYVADIYGFPYQQELQKLGYKKTAVETVHNLTLERWQK